MKLVVSLTVQVAVELTSTGLLSPVTVANAVKVAVPPFEEILALSGEIFRAVTLPRLTVILEVPLVAWNAAVIVAVPGDAPVTNPELLTASRRGVAAAPLHTRAEGLCGPVVVRPDGALLHRSALVDCRCRAHGDGGQHRVNEKAIATQSQGEQQKGRKCSYKLNFLLTAQHVRKAPGTPHNRGRPICGANKL